MKTARIIGLAVGFPDGVRTNDHFRRRNPELVADAQRRTLAKLWAPADAEDPSDFDLTFAPYARDPFRGTVERRALEPRQPILPLEARTARQALTAASLESSDVDVILSCAFQPDQLGIGNAVFIARELGFAGPAWNIETACTSAAAGLQLASALVASGQARRVLVVISCSYSRVIDPEDTFGWFLGDGCAAFVVGAATPGYGNLGAGNINTAETCGAFDYRIVQDDTRGAQLRIGTDRVGAAGRALKETAVPFLRRCVDAALRDADCRLDDIDFFAFNTPTAWYADLCVRTLGIDPHRTINVYPLYANVGPVLWPINLHHAAALGKIRPGDRVLVYAVGSVSSAAAIIMRWDNVGLGPLPARVRDLGRLAELTRVG